MQLTVFFFFFAQAKARISIFSVKPEQEITSHHLLSSDSLDWRFAWLITIIVFNV